MTKHKIMYVPLIFKWSDMPEEVQLDLLQAFRVATDQTPLLRLWNKYCSGELKSESACIYVTDDYSLKCLLRGKSVDFVIEHSRNYDKHKKYIYLDAESNIQCTDDLCAVLGDMLTNSIDFRDWLVYSELPYIGYTYGSTLSTDTLEYITTVEAARNKYHDDLFKRLGLSLRNKAIAGCLLLLTGSVLTLGVLCLYGVL